MVRRESFPPGWPGLITRAEEPRLVKLKCRSQFENALFSGGLALLIVSLAFTLGFAFGFHSRRTHQFVPPNPAAVP